MAQARVSWRGQRFVTQNVAPVVRARMDRAARQIVGEVRQRVSKPYPPASSPGQPPRRRTGRLMGSIRHEIRQSRLSITASIRARASHSSFLQRGTRYMDARPYLYLLRSQVQRLRRAVLG